MPRKLYQEIAGRIEQRLADDPEYRLPTLPELSRELGVSLMTVWKAVRVLSDKGLVRAHQGRKIRRADDPASRPIAESEKRLYARIKQSVLDGSYRAGDPLPKLQYYAVAERMARMTIVRVFRQLAHDGLIHKQGKSWIAGQQSRRLISGAREDPDTAPVALLVMLDDERLQNLFPNLHIAPFVNPFYEELMKGGMQVRLAHRMPSVLGEFPIPCGLAGVRSLIRKLGERYRGALLIDETLTNDDYITWAGELSCFGKKPVVLFDPSEVESQLTRKPLSGNERLFRLFFDEGAAVARAIECLTDAGHRNIGYALFQAPGYFWIQRRYERIVDIARSRTPALAIHSATLAELFWVTGGVDLQSLMPEFTRRIDAHVGPAPEGSRSINRQRRIMRATPSLASLLRRGITALICPNDQFAYQFWMWFKRVNIPVPRHMSLISFDNSLQGRIYPVSTIDFGFARLGYSAAHILIGDIPVQSDKAGNIAGTCTVIDRGSVGKPAQRRPSED
jgi:DNA-binding LacI/PurR family transcriptional regulator